MKKMWKAALGIAWCALLLLLVYRMFEGSWTEIGKAIAGSNPGMLVVLLMAGELWFFLDALCYHYLFRQQGHPITLLQAVRISLISPFSDVATMGAATKPVQMWYGYRLGIDPGVCASVTILPYAVQKVLTVVLGSLLFGCNYPFVKQHFPDTIQYFYIGIVGSLLIAVVLTMLCLIPAVHHSLMMLLKRLLKSGKRQVMLNKIETQLEALSSSGKMILSHPEMILKVSFFMASKLLIWYAIPIAALQAAFRSTFGLSAMQMLCMAAVLKLVMGVMPTSGGVGSMEVVFALIYSALLGENVAGTIMVLVRLSTYYVPFLVACLFLGGILQDYFRHEKTK